MRRRVLLILVSVLALIALLIGYINEGYNKDICGKSLAKYENGKYGDGTGPPLDAKKCAGANLRRGSTCYTAKNGKWTKNEKGTSCPFWMNATRWNSSEVLQNTRDSPFRVNGSTYYRKINADFSNKDQLLLYADGGKAKDAKDCANQCDFKGSECIGFVIKTKKEGDGYQCYGRKTGDPSNLIRPQQDSGVKGWKLFWKKNSVAANAASTPSASTSSTAPYVKVSNGTFFMSVDVNGTKRYLKMNATTCDTKNDDGVMGYDPNIDSGTINIAQYKDYFRWELTGSGYNGRYTIRNVQKNNQDDKGAKCDRTLGTASQAVKSCDKNNAVKWGKDTVDWFFADQGANNDGTSGYKIGVGNCGDTSFAWLRVNKAGNTARYVTKDEASTIYLQPA